MRRIQAIITAAFRWKIIICSRTFPAAIVLMLSGCFDTHPYDVDFDGEKHANERQIKEIEQRYADQDTLRIAFISDTHLWHSDARDEVDAINRRGDIDFVMHLGDLTDTGTSKEFEWSRDIFGRLHAPYVVLMGNHDFLGTGNQTYSLMFGAMDFSFIAARVKFVCLNTCATEYDYMAAVPNFDFMEDQFVKDSTRFDRTVVLMHAAPYSDQFNNNVCKAFRRYLDYFPGLMCCVYGHDHHGGVNDIYGDGLNFYAVDCAEHRNYLIMTINPDGYEMEEIHY